MEHLGISKPIAKFLGTFKNKQPMNGDVCSVAHLGQRKAADGKHSGKHDSARACEQAS